jgi:hypothetical protein
MRTASLLLVVGWLTISCAKETPETGFQPVGGDGAGASGAGIGTGATGASQGTGATGNGASGPASNSTTVSAGITVNSSSSGDSCIDSGPGEPNETEDDAHNLGTIDDCDGSGSSVSGVLDGPTDVDWYKYTAEDVSFCIVDPTRDISNGPQIRICKYMQCDGNEAVTFDCPSGTTASTSPDGRKGCCGNAGFDIDPQCGGSTLNADNGTIFIRIDNPMGHACRDYTLTYHY